MKSIVMFNNKGGVGKTTLLCNLASFLQTNKNKRVLVVDADPQCNASIYILGAEAVQNIIEEEHPNNILKLIQCVENGEGFLAQDAMPIESGKEFGVDLVVGDTSFSMYEDFLSRDWIDCKLGTTRGIRTTLLFWDMLQKVAPRYDYVFFDVGPSFGAINRSILLACDYFVVPMSIDVFSLRAVSNIGVTLSKWEREYMDGLNKYQEDNQHPFNISNIEPTFRLNFLGYVLQQYVAKHVKGVKQPVHAYEKIMEEMPDEINNHLAHFYPERIDKAVLKLGEIQNFNSLIPLSQTANKPIFNLKGADGIVGAHFLKVSEFKEVMEVISSNLFNNLSVYDRLG